MADMELIIKIPEEVYKSIQDNDYCGISNSDMFNAIKNGIPLPKGHGRLGDLDALEKEIVNGIKAGNYEEGYDIFAHINDMDDCIECVKFADTIIEADRQDEQNREDCLAYDIIDCEGRDCSECSIFKEIKE